MVAIVREGLHGLSSTHGRIADPTGVGIPIIIFALNILFNQYIVLELVRDVVLELQFMRHTDPDGVRKLQRFRAFNYPS